MSATNWNADSEEAFALAVAPILKEMANSVRDRLPSGTDFGVLVFAPADDRKGDGRVLAITTDRQRMARYAARWVLTVLGDEDR